MRDMAGWAVKWEEGVVTRHFWKICLLLCLLGLALRLPLLASRPLWMDETYSAWFSALPLHTLWTEVPLYETHPPMYYTLLKGWRALFGGGEAGLRSLSVLASMLTLLTLAVSGRLLRAGARGDAVALLAALFFAVNQGAIIYAQQCRPYALETLGAALAILSALVLLQRLRAQGVAAPRWSALLPPMAGLGLAMGATLWLHNTAVFIAAGIWIGLAAATLACIPGRRASQALAIALPGVLALLIWSPFWPMLLQQNAKMAGMAFWIVATRQDLVSAWILAGGGRTAAVPLILLALAGLARLWRSGRGAAVLLVAVLLLPLSAVLAYSYLVKPVYIDRLFEWMSVPLLGLAAFGLVAALRQRLWRAVALVAVLGLCLRATLAFYLAPAAEDWRGVAAIIAADVRPDDLLIVVPNVLSVPLEYYRGQGRAFPQILAMPAPFPARELPRRYVGNPGVPGLEPQDAALIDAALLSHKRIWLLTRLAPLYDPQGLVRARVAASRTLAGRFGDTAVLERFDPR